MFFFLDLNVADFKTTQWSLVLVLLLYLFTKNILLVNIWLGMFLILKKFLITTNLLQIFILFELIFLISILHPLLVLPNILKHDRVWFLINIFKWNLPTTCIGTVLLYCTYSKYLSFNISYLLYDQQKYFIVIFLFYFLLKISIWPILIFKYKIYTTASFLAIYFFNFNYFFFLQMNFLEIFPFIKITLGIKLLYLLLPYFIGIFIQIVKITSFQEFFLLASYTGYINFLIFCTL